MKKGSKKIEKEKKEKQPGWRIITENVECLAIAIVMALMLKFFLIEAYKIPTGSMQPTIMGNEERGLFDRVLVNKFIYLVSDPERYDVIVFKYPLNQSKNYIKRLIGLPGEKVGIADGDIFINGRLDRKPEDAIQAVLKKVYPTDRNGESFKKFFRAEGECLEKGADHIVLPGEATISSTSPVKTRYFDGYNPDYQIPRPRIYIDENQLVGDLRLTFSVKLEDDRGAVQARILEEGKEHTFFIRGKNHPGSSWMSTQPASRMDGREAKHAWSNAELFLEAGKKYDLAFTNIDDRLSIRFDGEEVAFHEYDYEGSTPKAHSNQVQFGTLGSGAELEEIRLYRDIYYISGTTASKPAEFQVPPGHYFAMGDNTQNSADSRLWQSAVFTLADGSKIKGNLDPTRHDNPGMSNPNQEPGGYYLQDVYGDERFISHSNLKRPGYEKEPEHFIDEKLMLGKAMCIFWPIYPHFRWKLLR